MMSGIGSSELKITTRSAEAQRYFNQGLRLLHCFWDFEAYRAFKEAVRLDPDATMAHWGMYQALQQNAGEMAAVRRAALERAVTLAPTASEVEQMYIRASAAAEKEGRAGYVREMEALVDRYPEQIEAQLFLARTLSAAPSSYDPEGRPREGKVYGQMILQNLLAKYPENAAVHHYWIHAVENGPNPERALESAVKLPKLAPNSGHMVHMTGHIFYRTGDYARAREAFLASTRVDQAYMRAQKIAPVDNWNYVHNLDYLIGNCAEDGRYAEGLRWADELAKIAVDASRRMSSGLGYLIYGGYSARARLHIRYGKWREAAEDLARTLAAHADLSTLVRGYLQGLRHYAQGMAALRAEQNDDAEKSLTELTALNASLAAERPQFGSDWYSAHGKRVLEVAAMDLRGSLLGKQGKHEEAIALLKQAAQKEKELGYWEPPHYARPVLGSLAEAQIAAGDFTSARQSYEQELKLRPRNGHALLGLARTFAREGKDAEARAAYANFAQAWSGADAALDGVQEAQRAAPRK